MNGTPLVDQAARDRIKDDLDATLIVEAAAGTGKTTALVERILSLLRSGRATLGSLVAVTFTEKAAGEMKLRLRTEIERARGSTSNADERARLGSALAELEAAHIGTIHAFCGDLLREHPIEAAVDPLFEVASEDASRRIYDEAFTRWFQETLKAPGEGVARVLRRATRERDQDGPRRALEKAGFSLIAQRDFPTPYERPDFDRRAAFDGVIEALAALGSLASKGYGESWLTKSLLEIRRAVEDIHRRSEARGEVHGEARTDAKGPSSARPAVDDYDAAEARLRTLARHKCWGWKGSGTWFNQAEGILRQTILDEREKTKRILEAALDGADADLAALLFREIHGVTSPPSGNASTRATTATQGSVGPSSTRVTDRGLVAAYESQKARSGKLDFLDLLLLTRDLLARDEAVRRELQSRFSHLLVDEFQDTDPLQAEILLLLAASDPTETDAERAEIVPGKLFVVGDPKQSIYRFRRADVSLYETIKERLVAHGASVVHLRTSFRSVPSIQAFVNAAFEPLMQANAARSQAAYVSLAAHRADPSGQPTIVALPVPRPYSDYGRIASWVIDESFPDAVGAFVDWLIHESGWTVSERGSDERVKIEARHVCLLFKRFQSFGSDCTRPYVRALEVRRIPHVLVGGKSFHDREEVIALRSALASIEWPDDTMSLYATLHGPFFALGDDALLAFKSAQGHLHYLRPRDASKLTELTKPVADALEVLARLHAGRNRRPIADTIAHLLEVTRAHAGIAIWPSGEQALGNVLRVLDVARRFEQDSATSFRAFVALLEDEAERGGANEAPMIEEGEGGVRIMTVHKAKGLEFPVVILVDPTANATFREPSRYVDPKRKLWAVPLCGASPKELLDRRDDVLAEDREESVRLLYVATTRARELLVVPVIGDERRDPSDGWLERLNPVVYPKKSARRVASPAEGCPSFGEDTVLVRPENVFGAGVPIRPGLHRPEIGEHSVVFWDPRVLRLDREDDAGLRQQKILSVDDKGVVAQSGVERHAAWLTERERTVASASAPSVVVRTVTEAKADGAKAPVNAEKSNAPVETTSAVEVTSARAKAPRGGDVTVEATSAATSKRPHGKRFGTLVHAVLATAPLDADPVVLADFARIQGRVLGASNDEVEAARDAVLSALAHPLLERARKAERVERESPVMLVDDDGGLLDGVVDLAFLEHDARGERRWTVVDFKTDAELEPRKDAYVAQVDAYARAVSRATSVPARGVLLRV